MTNATPLDPTIYTDMHGLAQLRGRARAEGDNHSPETLRQVAGQFEAMFVQMMLKNMRESSLAEGLFDSDQTKIYQGMYDEQIAQEITKGKGLGLADMLVRQLGGDSAAQATGQRNVPDPFIGPVTPARVRRALTAAQQDPPAGSAQVQSVQAQDPVQVHQTNWPPSSKHDFVQQLWPHAEQAARRLGIDPRAIVAQAALETGWGQHTMQQGDGRSSHNLFGIKADSRWSGPQVGARTMEYRDGLLTQEQARFRAYASPAESVADYAEFIVSNPRYDAALGRRDPRQYLSELQRAGYATDPIYAQKIMKIFNSEEFQMAVTEAKYQARQAAKPGEVQTDMSMPQAQLDNPESVAQRAGET